MALQDDREETSAGLVKPFLGHMEDLRRTIIWIGLSLVAGMVIAFPLAPWIIAVLKIPLRDAGKDPEQFLRVIEVTGGLSLAMQVIMWTGILLSAPFILLFIARFVFPGLKRRERKAVLNSLALAVVLFVVGVAVGYGMILRVTLAWMFQINDWLGLKVEFVRVTDYISFVLKLLLAFGLMFEFPVVILVLARLGLVTARFLGSKRRHVVVILLFASAVITPTVDPVTQVLLAAPLYVLYEMCIWTTWLMERQAAAVAKA